MSENNGKSKKGCFPIVIIVVIILFIIGGIGSCVGGDDEAQTTTLKSSTGIEEIEFSDSDPIELYVGESDFDHVNVDYDGEFSEDDIVFVSSDESVVTISLNRKGYSTVYYDVKGVGAGTATIHAETSDGIVKSEELTVTVAENKVVSINFPDYESLEFEVGATDSGYVNVDCEGDFSEDDIVFVSSDKSVVAISFDIKGYSKVYYYLEAVGTGIATIHAQTADGAVKSEEISVTVSENNTTATKAETTKAKAVVVDKETNAPKATNNTKEYVLNTNTMKIHESYCSSVKDISPDNYAETDDYDNAISQGYEPCKRCNP